MSWHNWLGIGLGCTFSVLFSSLAYALHDYSRTRLLHILEKHNREHVVEKIGRYSRDLLFAAALGRLLSNIVILVSIFGGVSEYGAAGLWWTVGAVSIASLCLAMVSVAIPASIAQYSGESLLAATSGLLFFMRMVLWPLTKIMHGIDGIFRRLFGVSLESQPQQIDEEILSVVEEGEKEGLVVRSEREMIESVIEFRDRQAGQIMTARPEIVGLPATSTLNETRQILEDSGLSRLPVFDGTLDHILGVLYARDLLKLVGNLDNGAYDARKIMRPAYYVPETKLLRDLLQDFRAQKVHMAIVLDEYGGTAGLITIEDVLEELVGDISDEHEPAEPALLKRLEEGRWEADARVYISDVNHELNLNLDEDAGYETLGGFITTTLGRIPEAGATIDHPEARFIVLDAEPQKIKRVRIEPMTVQAEAS